MTRHDFDDETLMACADGELDAAAARRVGEAAAADPEVAARIRVFRETREALRGAALARDDAPVPDALMARVRATLAAAPAASPGENVVPFRRRDASPRPRWQMSLVASAALLAGVLAGFLVAQVGGGRDGLRLAALDQPGLVAALGSTPSGERRGIEGGEIAPIASYLNGDGEFCREFEFDGASGTTAVSIACHIGQAWDIRFAVAARGTDDSGYAPASSLETLDAYLTATGAGAPLSPEEEAAFLSALEP